MLIVPCSVDLHQANAEHLYRSFGIGVKLCQLYPAKLISSCSAPSGLYNDPRHCLLWRDHNIARWNTKLRAVIVVIEAEQEGKEQ